MTFAQSSKDQLEQMSRWFDLSIDMLCLAGFDGCFKQVNAAWPRTLGWTVKELLSRPYLEFVHPDDRAATEIEGRNLITGRAVRCFENRYRCNDGTYKWLQWNAVPFTDERLIYAVARDVSAQKAAEEALRKSRADLQGLVVDRTAALRESQERFETVFRNSAIGMALVGTDGAWLQVNGALCGIVGYSEQELLGMTVQNLTHPEDLQGDVAHLQRVLSGEISFYQKDRRYIHKLGHVVWVQLNAALVRDADKRPLCIVSQYQDITEFKRSKRTLEALLRGTASVTGEEFFSVFVQQLAIAVGARYAFVAETVRDQPGRVRVITSWVGDCWDHAFEYDVAKTPCASVYEGGKAYYREGVRALFPDHEYLAAIGAVGYLGVALKDSSEQIVGHVAIIDTKPLPEETAILAAVQIFVARAAAELERKRVEEARRRSEAFLSSVLEHLPDMVFIKDAEDLRFLRFNKAGEDLLGYPREALIGKNDYDFFPRQEAEYFAAKDREALAGREVVEIAEEPIQTKSGRRYVHTKKIPILDGAGHPRYLLGISQDITDRKLTEIMILDREARLRAIVDHAAEGIVTIDERGIVETFNPAASRIFGYEAMEVIGRNVAMLMDGSDRDGHDGFLQAYVKTGRGAIIGSGREVVGRRKDGATFPLDLAVSPMQVDGRRLFTGILRDITERKQAEAALRESEARLQAILDQSPAMVFLKDLEGRYILTNRQFERTFHLTREGIAGRRDEDLFPPEQAAAFVANDRAMVQAGVPMQFEEVASHSDGLHTSLVDKFPLRDAEGRVYAIGGIVTDITDRKRMETALHESERKFRLLAESAMDLIYQIDASGLVTYASPASQTMLGYAPSDLVGTDFRLYLDDASVGPGEVAFRAAMGGEIIPALEVILVGRDGRRVMCEVSVGPIREGAKIVGVHGASRDITERKRTEAALRESEGLLRQVLEERERLSQDLHDNIIQMIYAIGLTLEGGLKLLPTDPAETARTLARSIDGLNGVIADVRKHIVGMADDAMDGAQLCARLAKLVTVLEGTKTIAVDLAADPAAAARLTPEEARHAFVIVQEALSNSLKHAQGRRVLVTLACWDGGVRVAIEDDGRGFDPSARTAGPGAGRGLRNIAARAALLGARLDIGAAIGQGTKITLDVMKERA